MKSKAFAVLASLLAAALLFSGLSVAFAQEEVPSLDLGDLGFRVTNTEVVDEITNEQGDRLRAENGQKLVVVTLEGEAPESGDITAHPEGFIARSSDTLIPSGAVTLEDDEWIFGPAEQGEEETDAATLTIDEPGQVTVKVAFFVDEDVTEFDVLVPTEAEGTATVPENGTTPEDGTTQDETVPNEE